MAVQTDISRIAYAGNNSTETPYAVPFLFLEAGHLFAVARSVEGVETAVTLTNHQGTGDPNGGSVRTSTAIPGTSTLTIFRSVPITQLTSYQEGGDFPAASHERALDKLTQICQQLFRQVGSAFRFSEPNQVPPLDPPTNPAAHVLTIAAGNPPTWEPPAASSIPGSLFDLPTANLPAAADQGIILQGGLAKLATVESLAKGTDANVHNVGSVGWNADDFFPPRIWRFRDRVFIGDAAEWTGNNQAGSPNGVSWVMQKVASYFFKTAVVASAGSATTRGGFGAQATAALMGVSRWMGVGAVAVNEGDSPSNTSRGLYAEGMRMTTTPGHNATAAELQVGNYLSTTLPVANAWNMVNSQINALQIGAESGHNYLRGATNPGDPLPTPTMPCGTAIDITGGSIGAAYQKFVTGIVVRHVALHLKTFGATDDVGIALSMARKHQVEWIINTNSETGSFIRSDVSAANRACGLVFRNSAPTFVGADFERPICQFIDAHTAPGAVNYWEVNNSLTGFPVQIRARGTDTNIPCDIISKGGGVISFKSHDGSTNVRISPPATAPVDHLALRGGAGAVTVFAAGDSTNIDLVLTPKGTGTLRTGTHTGIGAETVTGFITIKDSGGTLRKLAVVS